MRRRQFIAGSVAASTVILAGCLGDPELAVRVQYSGSWSGAITEAGGTSSISGTGERTIDIDDDTSIVSANAQKSDSGGGELTIQVIEDGDVVAEESTRAGFGVAQVTHDV